MRTQRQEILTRDALTIDNAIGQSSHYYRRPQHEEVVVEEEIAQEPDSFTQDAAVLSAEAAGQDDDRCESLCSSLMAAWG